MSPAHLLARAGAAAMQGARRSRLSAGPPVISGTVLIGETLTSTAAGQWYRDGVAISGETGSSYVVVAADIGPAITCNGSNELRYDDAAHLPETAVFANPLSGHGITRADSDTTWQSWASQWGGVSCTLAAPASTNRPASSSGGVGGRLIATFDGVDDVLAGALTKGSAFSTYELGFVGQRVALSALNDRLIGYFNGTTLRFGIIDRTTSTIRWTVNLGSNQDFSTDPDGSLRHWSGESAGGTQSARENGTIVATNAATTTTSRNDGETFALGGSPGGTLGSAIVVHAAYCGPALTATQRTHLRALLTYLTGVSC